MKFILGYEKSDSVDLTQFESTEEASFNSEEYCTVEANSLQEAKEKYEETFEALKSEGKINGCM